MAEFETTNSFAIDPKHTFLLVVSPLLEVGVVKDPAI